jgi:hypothetical protein
MSFDVFFSKVEILWSDKMRWARRLSVLLLLLCWIVLVFFWMLMVTGLAPISMPQGLITFLQYETLILLIAVKTFYISAKYLQDIYEAPTVGNTLKYLLAVVFGWNTPKLKISGEKKEFKGDYNSIESIGGPGVLQIGRDNVVVLETLQTQKNILMAGERPITRFDFVKEVFSTEEQYGKIEKFETLTADGIQVAIYGVLFRFRVDGIFRQAENDFQVKDYIPSKKAVISLVYHRPVNVDGDSSVWTDAVSGAVTGIIKEHVNSASLDDLIAPNNMGEHSLDALRQKFISSQIHNRFKSMGVKFISCNIGEIKMISTDIDKERLNAWFVKQSGVMKVIRAQGDAESFVSHERGRTEGQAMLLKSIANALQDIGIKGNDATSVRKNLRNILLTRTAQILESRTSVYHKHAKEDGHGNSEGSR